MSTTARRRQNVNSLNAYWHGQIEWFSKRQNLILAHLRHHPHQTDREVMIALGFTDMNSVRPRISELIDDGLLQITGSRECPITHMTVHVTRVRPLDERRVQAEFDLKDLGRALVERTA